MSDRYKLLKLTYQSIPWWLWLTFKERRNQFMIKEISKKFLISPITCDVSCGTCGTTPLLFSFFFLLIIFMPFSPSWYAALPSPFVFTFFMFSLFTSPLPFLYFMLSFYVIFFKFISCYLPLYLSSSTTTLNISIKVLKGCNR